MADRERRPRVTDLASEALATAVWLEWKQPIKAGSLRAIAENAITLGGQLEELRRGTREEGGRLRDAVAIASLKSIFERSAMRVRHSRPEGVSIRQALAVRVETARAEGEIRRQLETKIEAIREAARELPAPKRMISVGVGGIERRDAFFKSLAALYRRRRRKIEDLELNESQAGEAIRKLDLLFEETYAQWAK